MAKKPAKPAGAPKPAPEPKPRTKVKDPPKPAPAAAAATGAPPVRVRMYRQGLGDCFLLSFGEKASARHMLIDCGTLGASTGISLKEAVKDITKETGGKLELLVLTHEHMDHVRGLIFELEAIKALKPSNVWLAWTEDKADPLAQSLKKYSRDLGFAVAAGIRLAPADSRAAATPDLLGFFGDDPGTMLGAGKFSPTVDEAMKAAQRDLGARVEYLRPGPPAIEPSFIPGFRFYVLGPPRDLKALRETGEHGSPGLYGLSGLAAAAARSLRAALGEPPTAADRAAERDEYPFDERYGRAGTPPPEEWTREYSRASESWRRIDGSWLDSVPELALQLDSLTNNTSLALAIERIADGRVLLFPADAQLGNWESWHGDSMEWKLDGATVRAEDLLARTVFYKVGHHASHNATAKAKGLELMKRTDELTAFIPVDRAIALTRHPKNAWQMPARALYRRLLEQCRGRVVRSDLEWAAAAQAGNADEQEFVGMATKKEWDQWQAAQNAAGARVKVQRAFVDFFLT